MAPLRMQHRKGGNTGAASLLKVFGLFLVLFLLLFLGIYWIKSMPLKPPLWKPADTAHRFFLPEADSTVKVVHGPFFSMGYAANNPRPIWAACEWDARMEGTIPTFYDSNYFQLDVRMAPAWKEWGSKGQETARRLGKLFVVAGPAPGGYFLVWLDEGFEKLEAIGLLFPDSLPFQPVAVSLDSLENLSGLDFLQGIGWIAWKMRWKLR
ncbi:MAG: hypothetical protein IPJ40_05935 [Saprospirales bacterium]|nr:hypothetical protein [Saprospirales bacterium]